MADTVLHSDPTLAEWLAAHARSVSARRLTLDLIGGVVVVVAAVLGRPRGWPALLGVALCFVSFAAWAAAERRFSRPLAPDVFPPPATLPSGGVAVAWRALHVTAGVVGVLAAMLAGFGLLFGLLGTWIS